MAFTRRQFLCRSFGAFGAAALAFERFGLFNALAQSAGDYKALVCIFLFGGNDAGNMVIPYTDYATYSAARQAAGLAIPQTSLLQISPPSIAGSVFGLHPSLTGLHELWGMGKLAVVCNVGPLVEPTNRTSYRNGTVRVPLNLFSHSDQQNQWQTSVSDGAICRLGGTNRRQDGRHEHHDFPTHNLRSGHADFYERKHRASLGDCRGADTS